MNPQPGKPTVLKLEPNVPHELALHHTNGMEVNGNYGPQVLFTLKGNRRLYVPPEVAAEIRALSLAPGQPFIVTKVQGERSRSFNWVVERKPAHGDAPAPADPVCQFTKIESALKTAIAAACAAEKFGEDIGYKVKFSEQSIKSMACTVMIEMGRAA
jgi:hypothetical protein